MTLEQRLNKLEESFTDEQINEIVFARLLYARTKNRCAYEKIVEITKERFPNVPIPLLTAKLSGRLLDAELNLQQRERNKLNWSKETAEREARALIESLRKTKPHIPLEHINQWMQENPLWRKVDFQKLRKDYL